MKGQVTIFFLIGLVLVIIIMLLVFTRSQEDDWQISEEMVNESLAQGIAHAEWTHRILLEDTL